MPAVVCWAVRLVVKMSTESVKRLEDHAQMTLIRSTHTLGILPTKKPAASPVYLNTQHRVSEDGSQNRKIIWKFEEPNRRPCIFIKPRYTLLSLLICWTAHQFFHDKQALSWQDPPGQHYRVYPPFLELTKNKCTEIDADMFLFKASSSQSVWLTSLHLSVWVGYLWSCKVL